MWIGEVTSERGRRGIVVIWDHEIPGYIPREVLERVIDDLETKRDFCRRTCTPIPDVADYFTAKAYDYAITELRKVLEDHG